MEFDTEVPLNHTTVVSVQNPNRIVHHPSDSKFELVKDVVELKVGDQHERVRLAEVDASFGENVVIDITLPPQASQLSGELWVGCEYGDGRIEYCNPYEVAKLPCYGQYFLAVYSICRNVTTCALKEKKMHKQGRGMRASIAPCQPS